MGNELKINYKFCIRQTYRAS